MNGDHFLKGLFTHGEIDDFDEKYDIPTEEDTSPEIHRKKFFQPSVLATLPDNSETPNDANTVYANYHIQSTDRIEMIKETINLINAFEKETKRLSMLKLLRNEEK